LYSYIRLRLLITTALTTTRKQIRESSKQQHKTSGNTRSPFLPFCVFYLSFFVGSE